MCTNCSLKSQHSNKSWWVLSGRCTVLSLGSMHVNTDVQFLNCQSLFVLKMSLNPNKSILNVIFFRELLLLLLTIRMTDCSPTQANLNRSSAQPITIQQCVCVFQGIYISWAVFFHFFITNCAICSQHISSLLTGLYRSRFNRPVRSRSYWHSGWSDSIHCCSCERRQRSQFIEEYALTESSLTMANVGSLCYIIHIFIVNALCVNLRVALCFFLQAL